MKNLFITGALGQDGIIIVNKLKKNKKLNVYSIIEKKKKIKKKKNLISLDLSKKKDIQKVFLKIKPDFILHLASRNPSYNEKGYYKYFNQNMLATKNIFFSTFEKNINAKFIFCNSSKIFKQKHGKVNENSIFFYDTPYSRFRVKSHEIMLNFKKKNKINYTNVILFNHDSIYRNKKFLIPRLINSLIYKDYKFMKKIIDFNISADFSHADDVCNGLVKILLSKRNDDNVILSSGKLTKINDIIKFVIKKKNILFPFKILKNKNKIGLVGSNSFAKRKFNWFIKKDIFRAALELYDNLNNKVK